MKSMRLHYLHSSNRIANKQSYFSQFFSHVDDHKFINLILSRKFILWLHICRTRLYVSIVLVGVGWCWPNLVHQFWSIFDQFWLILWQHLCQVYVGRALVGVGRWWPNLVQISTIGPLPWAQKWDNPWRWYQCLLSKLLFESKRMRRKISSWRLFDKTK